jgi:excisionase family DNA binding protein
MCVLAQGSASFEDPQVGHSGCSCIVVFDLRFNDRCHGAAPGAGGLLSLEGLEHRPELGQEAIGVFPDAPALIAHVGSEHIRGGSLHPVDLAGQPVSGVGPRSDAAAPHDLPPHLGPADLPDLDASLSLDHRLFVVGLGSERLVVGQLALGHPLCRVDHVSTIVGRQYQVKYGLATVGPMRYSSGMTVSDGGEEEPTMSIQEAAAESGIGRTTIFRWVAAGKLRLAPKLPGDQRTRLYRADVLREAAKARPHPKRRKPS